ncbi:unnamed protein product [Paramecium octaurelia]|uniref:Insulin-like growth factor binding protein, N-terminal n=1 Tax=Paramecium octaurelia TaxID=43137 RepID=A0A8S1W6S9_PAROT|nr:unnamed protein product [Paramecium octaurelia]
MISTLLLVFIDQLKIRCELIQLYENFNSLKIEKTIGWSCLNNQYPIVYNCKYGMDLIKVDMSCNEIQHKITEILPHFQVQIYVDIYFYGDLNAEDKIVILIDEQQWQNTYLPTLTQPLGKSHQCISYDQNRNYQIRKTLVIDLSHNIENLNLVLRSTLSQNFETKSYLFRNLQIFYNPCSKTCKTCNGGQTNQCTSCYQNIPLTSGTCSSCKWNINLTFLLIPKGCVVQCPDEYSYDKDKVCQKNSKLITYTASQLIKNKESYQISGNLESSVILLRLTLKVELSGKNQVVLQINGKKIATISQFNIQAKLKYQYLQTMKQQIIEFDAPINSGQFIIKIDGSKKIFAFNVLPKVKVQYFVCALNCQLCKDNENCEICLQNYFLYFGECLTTCPDPTIVSNKSCIYPLQLNYDESLEVRILVKEFYDFSTTKERVNELFTLQETNNSIYNFQKGEQIYFSYLDKKRIFGGPFVWVNAKFKFDLKLENIRENIVIYFDVILGDEKMNRTVFHYKINSQDEKTLILNNKKDLKLDQNWSDDYCVDVISVRETIEYQDNNNQLIILFYCDNSFNNANTTFCGIQNLIVAIQPPKSGESGLSEEEEQIDDQDLESTFEISICGDEKVSEDEECDDGNLVPFDGCFNCQYQCQYLCQFCIKGECLFMFEEQSFKQTESNISQGLDEKLLQVCHIYCEICIQGICLQCQTGYYMNIISNICESKCGDIIISGQEQCDDGNLDNYDGCSDCQFNEYENCPKLQTCAVCHYDKCLKCIDGYTLENNKCISICGDALINKLEEQCDNPNEKGCVNCQIETGYVCSGISYSVCKTCGDYCTVCQTINQFNLICKDCLIGYYPVLDRCLECDKNCISCKGQSNLCTSCYRSDCELCESVPGFYTDFERKRCFAQCGDGILVIDEEECDDGNIEDADGCDSQCKIEFAQKQLNDLLVWHFNGNSSYEFSLMNSEYKLELNCQDPLIAIDGMDKNDFFFNISVINNICRVEFVFFKSVFKSNTIHVELSLSFQENRLLYQNNVRVIQFDIQPNEQIILSADEKMQANQIANVQQSFGFLFVLIIPVSIVTNLYEYLWGVLEILSWVNNFYFLNVHYPFNVEIFLLNQDWSAFVALPTYQGLNQPDCSYYFAAPLKFQNKGIDPLFFNNIQIPFIFIITIFLIYELNFILLSLLNALISVENNKIQINHKHFSIFCLQAKRKTQQTQVQQLQQDRRRTHS